LNIVIIGAGIAAFSLVQSLRRINSEHRITVITACNADQYYKPNLSQALSRNIELDKLTTSKANDWASQYGVALIPNQWVTAINSSQQIVQLNDSEIAYDKLVLATGAKPVDIPCSTSSKIFHLNSLESYRQLREQLVKTSETTIIGAGLVGCELASDLAQAGYKPHLVYPQDEPLMKLFPKALCLYIKSALETAGVKCSSNRKVVNITSNRDNHCLQLSDGNQFNSSIVVNCAGLTPNTYLAKDAGLIVNKGIAANELLQTSNNNIFTLGDCAEINGALHQYVAPIVQSARALASTLCGTPLAVSLGSYPVAVKIQQIPLVFTLKQAVNDWTTEEVEGGMIARARDEHGQLIGYALAGAAQGQRATLAAELANQTN
jgi:rubredoxin-NAD+ reductase